MPTTCSMVAQWPAATVTLEQLERAASRLQPIAGLELPGRKRPSRRRGQALWATHVDGRPIGLAWEWVQVDESTVALTDPMRVLTNLILARADGRMLDDDESLLRLSGVIYTLPWQQELLGRPAAFDDLAGKPVDDAGLLGH